MSVILGVLRKMLLLLLMWLPCSPCSSDPGPYDYRQRTHRRLPHRSVLSRPVSTRSAVSDTDGHTVSFVQYLKFLYSFWCICKYVASLYLLTDWNHAKEWLEGAPVFPRCLTGGICGSDNRAIVGSAKRQGVTAERGQGNDAPQWISH